MKSLWKSKASPETIQNKQKAKKVLLVFWVLVEKEFKEMLLKSQQRREPQVKLEFRKVRSHYN